MFSPEKKFCDWKLCGFENSPAALFETIESTHSEMKARAAAGAIIPGTLFVANSQSAGRGRHQRTWVSPVNKNLYFNILIPLDGIAPNQYPQITQITALTFAEVFQSIGANVTVKWPNDILYNKSKFCGILAEIVWMPNHRAALSLGVGINVNSDAKDFEFLERDVTTLKEILGKPLNRELLLRGLIGALERALGQFHQFGITPWVNAWRKMDKFIGAKASVIVNNNCTDENQKTKIGAQKKEGTIIDMQNDGSLLFKTTDGEIISVYSADLEI